MLSKLTAVFHTERTVGTKSFSVPPAAAAVAVTASVAETVAAVVGSDVAVTVAGAVAGAIVVAVASIGVTVSVGAAADVAAAVGSVVTDGGCVAGLPQLVASTSTIAMSVVIHFDMMVGISSRCQN
jgi:hypothetical protein